MTRIRQYLLFVLPALLAAVFATAPATPAWAIPPSPPTEVVLAPQGYLVLPDGARLTFTGVPNDSRCPIEARCIWAGEVTITFQLETGNGTSPFEIRHSVGPSSQTVDGYQVEVIDLEPHPSLAQPIEPNDYRVTVHIRGT